MTSKLDFAANPFTANNYINETAHHPIKLIAATEDAEANTFQMMAIRYNTVMAEDILYNYTSQQEIPLQELN
ncbi:hypothetical protein GX48_03609 [Paracoccidioides brasiliensis]|nr:hypothetical protein GX48_03609 [Paracoccidioides brasiliensis]